MDDKPATKVVTYQCLCKVKGRVKFKLVTAIDDGEGVTVDPDDVLDEITVESPSADGFAFTDTMLVTLRAQVKLYAPDDAKHAVVWIENLVPTEIISALKVFWQQAWGGTEAADQEEDYPLALGLANSGQVRTTDHNPVPNTYNWAVNALGIKAASKFQLPLLQTGAGGDAAGMGWLSPEDLAAQADLQDGDVYQDKSQNAMLGRCTSRWMVFAQPDTVSTTPGSSWTGGDAKNLIFSASTGQDFTLGTTLDEIPWGSIVRVFNLGVNGGSPPAVNVKVGGSSLSSVSSLHMSEFLFYVDDSDPDPGNWVGRWLVVQGNVTTKQLP